jgi:hypothetical protein
MPLQTALDNLEQKLTQMGSAATAVGLEDHRAMLAATRKRTREGHVAMANAAGTQLESEADEVGDLIMTGDIQLQKDADQPAATHCSAPKLPSTSQPRLCKIHRQWCSPHCLITLPLSDHSNAF